MRPLFENTQRVDPAAAVSLATPRTQGARTSRGPAAWGRRGRPGERRGARKSPPVGSPRPSACSKTRGPGSAKPAQAAPAL